MGRKTKKVKDKIREEIKQTINDDIVTAILVDGGFYRRRAYACLGDISAEERADELYNYCKRHLNEKIDGVTHSHQLYRIFYYDCPPVEKMFIIHSLRKMLIYQNHQLLHGQKHF